MSDAALTPDAPPAGDPPPAPPAAPPAPPSGNQPPAPPAAPPIATGNEPPTAPPEKPYWPEDWRDKMAGTADKRNPVRKALERFTEPTAIFNSYDELRRWRDAGGVVKLPGEKAPPEEIAAFHKALGVPEKPEQYLENLKLDNGAILGDVDKPAATAFAAEMHKVGAPPAVVNQALNWYLKNQEQAAAALDQADETFRMESERTLKEEYGPTFTRYRNAISSLFMTAPGGSSAEGSLFSRLMTGRLGDGKIIGNDPDVVKWLVGLVREVNPYATATEQGNQQGQSVDDEIKSIEADMRDPQKRREYFKDEKKQARYRELLDARGRAQARNAA